MVELKSLISTWAEYMHIFCIDIIPLDVCFVFLLQELQGISVNIGSENTSIQQMSHFKEKCFKSQIYIKYTRERLV